MNWVWNVSWNVEKLALALNSDQCKRMERFRQIWKTYGIQLIGRVVNKDVLCTLAVTSPCVPQRNVRTRLFEMLKQEKQQRKYRDLRLNPPFTLIYFRLRHYKKEHGYQQDSFTKTINAHGAGKRRTRNIKTVHPVNCWRLSNAPSGRILKETFHF